MHHDLLAAEAPNAMPPYAGAVFAAIWAFSAVVGLSPLLYVWWSQWRRARPRKSHAEAQG